MRSLTEGGMVHPTEELFGARLHRNTVRSWRARAYIHCSVAAAFSSVRMEYLPLPTRFCGPGPRVRWQPYRFNRKTRKKKPEEESEPGVLGLGRRALV